MPSLPKSLLAGAVAAAALALPANPAQAATYCVHHPGFSCPAGSVKTGTDLQQALTSASQSDVADKVVIGPGTFFAPEQGWKVTSDSPLTVSGTGGTVLDGATKTTSHHVFVARSATLEKFTLELAPGGQSGIDTRSGTLRNLAILGNGGSSVGIDTYGSMIDAVKVAIPGGVGAAVRARPSYYSSSVRRSELSAGISVTNFGGGDAHVSRGRLYGGVRASNGNITVTDSRVWLSGEGVGLEAECGPNEQNGRIVANHVTVLGGTGTTGARSECWFGYTSALTVRNSILATELGLHRHETAGTATLVATSNVIPAGAAAFKDESLTPDGGMYRSGNLHTTPKFNSVYSLSLGKGSPGIDAAKPNQLTTAFDAMTKPRPMDGDGDGVAVADMGAMERQIP